MKSDKKINKKEYNVYQQLYNITAWNFKKLLKSGCKFPSQS